MKRVNTKVATRPPMDREVRRRLVEEFSIEIDAVEEMISGDLRAWRQW